MKLAGVAAFWVGLAAFWAVTVTMVVSKPGDAKPPQPIANDISQVGSRAPAEDQPAAKPSKPGSSPSASPKPSDVRAGEPLDARPVTHSKVTKLVQEKDLTSTGEPVVAPSPKPRVSKKPIPPEPKASARKVPATRAASSKEPKFKMAETIEPAIADAGQPPEEPSPPPAVKVQPAVVEAPSSPVVAARKKPTKTPPSETRTSLVLNVPEDAIVYLNGRKTRTAGTVREYATTRLQAGSAVRAYSVRVEVIRGGKTIVQERTIRLQAGQRHEMTVEFVFVDASG